MLRILHVTDTHLRPGLDAHDRNWDAVVAHVEADRPDLVVNTGDIAMDAPSGPGDLAHAARQHARLPVEWRAIPGNHDVGDDWGVGERQTSKPISDDWRREYQAAFGPEWWMIDRAGWRLVGANSQLMGSGLDDEEHQWADLAAWLDAAPGPAVLFVHKPTFLDDPAEPREEFRYLQDPARSRLLDLLADSTVVLVASGHTHQHRRTVVGGRTWSWAPSTAFVMPPDRQPLLGQRVVGAVEIILDGNTAETRLVQPAGMVETLPPEL